MLFRIRYRQGNFSIHGVNGLEIVIEEISFNEVLVLKTAYVKEGMKLRNSRGTVWLSAKYNGEVVGVCAYRQKRYGILCKSDLVLKEYRGLGIYRQLFNERLKRVKRLNPNKIYAYCTRNSIHTYLKQGFVKKGRIKRITYVELKGT